MSARTRPQAAPATIGSPTCSVPCCDQHGGDRAPADVEVRLEHDADGAAVGVAAVVLDLGHDEQVLEQVVDADALQRGDLDHDGVAAPLLGHQALLGQLGHHPGRIGVLAVDLVDRHDDRHLGGVGVVERLERLGHDAVVGRHDEHDDVGGLGATGPHGGERLVARRVDEGDRLAVLHHLVGTDVLGDATGLAGDDVGVADAVEQLGLAVVDVAHDGDDRRPRRSVVVVDELLEVEQLLQLDLLLLAGIDQAHLRRPARRRTARSCRRTATGWR